MLILLLAACIPLPHNQHRAPAIRGVVLTPQGAPRPGVEVQYAAGDAAPIATRTDDQGAFHVVGPIERELFFAFGDRLDTWTLALSVDGQTHTLHDRGYWGGPSQLDARCEVADGARAVDVDVRTDGDSREASADGLRCTFAPP